MVCRSVGSCIRNAGGMFPVTEDRPTLGRIRPISKFFLYAKFYSHNVATGEALVYCISIALVPLAGIGPIRSLRRRVDASARAVASFACQIGHLMSPAPLPATFSGYERIPDRYSCHKQRDRQCHDREVILRVDHLERPRPQRAVRQGQDCGQS